MEEGGNIPITHTTQVDHRGERGGLPGSGLESTNPPVDTHTVSVGLSRMPLRPVRSTGPLLPSGAQQSLLLNPVFTKDTAKASYPFPFVM